MVMALGLEISKAHIYVTHKMQIKQLDLPWPSFSSRRLVSLIHC